MKVGYSLLLREFIQADEVDYGDCKDFQITCPSCSEAVFKVGSADGERRYLSHYRGGTSDVAECELRVASMSRAGMDAANSQSRGQSLELFQKRFLEATLESLTPADTPENDLRSRLRRMVGKAVARPAFRAYVRVLGTGLARSIRTTDGMRQLLGDGRQYRSGAIEPGQPHRKGQSEFWVARQMGYAGDYAHHLFAPGSLRTLYDATAIGLFKTRRVIRNVGVVGDNERFLDEATDILLYGTDGRLSSFLTECRRTVILHDGHEGPTISLLDSIAMQCLRAALVEFPYVQTAMDASGQRVDPAHYNVKAA